ncbi:hypothetical protein PFISCL1PPCAC_26688, partial [Pristionchus fissidentatus]
LFSLINSALSLPSFWDLHCSKMAIPVGLILGIVLVAAGVTTMVVYKLEDKHPDDDPQCFPQKSGTIGIRLHGFRYGNQSHCQKLCEEKNRAPEGKKCTCSRNLTIVLDERDFIQISFNPIEGINSTVYKADYTRPRGVQFEKVAIILEDMEYTKHGSVYSFEALGANYFAKPVGIELTREELSNLTYGSIDLMILSQTPLKGRSCSATGLFYDVDDMEEPQPTSPTVTQY